MLDKNSLQVEVRTHNLSEITYLHFHMTMEGPRMHFGCVMYWVVLVRLGCKDVYQNCEKHLWTIILTFVSTGITGLVPFDEL